MNRWQHLGLAAGMKEEFFDKILRDSPVAKKSSSSERFCARY
jgi:hypothetical protein